MAKKSNDRTNSGKSIDKVTKINIPTDKDRNPMPVTPAVHDLPDEKLKACYSAIVSEPIPDRLAELMARLEAQSRAESVSDADNSRDP
jgi:Anti-sigma factor NepR